MQKIIVRLLWKLFSIQKREIKFVLPLFFLYFLSGSFYAVGQIYTETLFLKTYGAQGLSRFFIYNGIALIVAGIVYNYVLLRVSLKRGYILLIVLFSTLIYFAQNISFESHIKIPFYLYIGNYLFTFYLDVHYFNYSSQYLSLQSAKRLLPFLLGGGKLGGIVASLFLIVLFGEDVVLSGGRWWLVNGILLVVPLMWMGILYRGEDRKVSVERYELLPDARIFEKILQKLKLSFSTPIFYVSVIAVFTMAIVNAVSEYYFTSIFNEIFTSKNDLAIFLSLYTLIADVITLVVQLFIASRVIRTFGVKKSNYIYPATFLLFFCYMIVSPGLIAGILIRFFRKNMSIIFRQPVFNIILSAAPRHRISEIKSFISGIILPVGLIAGGWVVLFIDKKLTLHEGYIFAGILGMMYFFFTAFQNRAYVMSLKQRLLYDTASKNDIVTMIDYADLEKHPEAVKMNRELLEAIFRASPNAELLHLLLPHFSDLSIESKEKMLIYSALTHRQFHEDIIRKAIQSEEPQLRALALRSIRHFPYVKRVELLQEYPVARLESEQIALEILLIDERQAHGDSDIEASSFAISLLMKDNAVARRTPLDSRIVILKNQILQGRASTVEFYLLAQVFESPSFAHMLAEVALATKDVILFKAIIAHAHFLSRKIARKLLCAFAGAPFYLIAHFIAVTPSLTDADKAMLLNRRFVFAQNEIEEIFGNGEFYKSAAVKRIFRKYDYVRLSNYFKYLIAVQAKVDEEMLSFVRQQNILIGKVQVLRRILCNMACANKTESTCIAFLDLALKREIELRKHLLLKAVSVMTGTEIDYAYESSIFLKDREITEYVREFIETLGKSFKDSVYIFEDDLLEAQSRIRLDDSESMVDAGEVLLNTIKFLPGLKDLVGFACAHVVGNLACRSDVEARLRTYLKKKDDAMLNVMGKIIFLKENPLFSDIGIDELVRIAHITHEIEFPAGKMFIRENDVGEELFIIIEGEVEIIKGKKVIETLADGSCIGELSIVDSEPRSASVKTKKRTRLLSIKRKDFLLTVKENPEIAIGVMKVIAQRFRRAIAK